MSATDVFNVSGQGTTLSIAATATSGSATLTTPLASNSPNISIYNKSTTDEVYVRWGVGAQTATTLDTPIPPGAVLNFYKGVSDTFAAICLGGKTATVFFTPGLGM